MIANITQGSFLSGVLQYNEKKIEEGEAQFFNSNIINTSKKNIDRVFFNLLGNSKRKDKVFHVSLNFLEQDYEKLGEENLKLLAEDYLQEIGFPEDHPYVSYLHFDKKHPHIHIVTSKILENKKVLNDSLLFRKSQRVSRKLEKKYNIFNITQHYKRNLEHIEKEEPILKSEIIKKYNEHKIPLNQLIEELSIASLKEKRPLNMVEYKNILSNYNIQLEETDFTHKGLIYRFEDDTSGIKASNLSKELHINSLEKTFEKNKQQKIFSSKYVAKQIDYLFEKYDSITYQKFIEELSKKGIVVNANITNDVLRGFRYQYNGFSYKGQELPKRAYTMSKIKHKFSATSNTSEAYWSKYKHQFNKDKINNNDLMLYIKDTLKIGFVPLLTEKGIYLRRKDDYLFNLPIKSLDLQTDFNSILSKLTPAQIVNFNQIIKDEILKEIDNRVGEELTKNTTQNIEEFIDALSSIFDTEEYHEQGEDNMLPQKKKRKRKRGL